MRNITLITIFSLFFTCSSVSNAQKLGRLTYKQKFKQADINYNSDMNLVIYFRGNKSIQLRIKNENLKDQKIDDNTEIKVVSSKRPSFILKDLSTKKLILSDNIAERQYLISDIADLNWNITREKKRILNYDCIKATTTFRGRNYVAWFTESIPIQNGPWKFCGLPGLIIKVNDDKGIFSAELTGIDLKAKFDEGIITVPKEYAKEKSITHGQFMTIFKKKVADYAKLSKVVQTGKNGSYSTVEITLPEKLEKF